MTVKNSIGYALSNIFNVISAIGFYLSQMQTWWCHALDSKGLTKHEIKIIEQLTLA